MADLDEVAQIVRSLPETSVADNGYSFAVLNRGKPKGIAWVWLERAAPNQPRRPNPAVLAVRVASVMEKDMLLAADPAIYFTEPHYTGYPAVLVRLGLIDLDELAELLTGAWRVQAPKKLVQAYDQRRGAGE